ncbi:MAG: rhomboid family intramembrane serine protease, partial [Actinomycetota bacterium]|nr:rhomboid family intramembrane serine protease [Actinomycetota bacterium]
MRDASVGFHCPDCVREGSRTTRQGRATYGGKRVLDAARTSMVLIGLNALVWLAVMATGGASSSLIDKLALLPQSSAARLPNGAVHVVEGVSGGGYWQIVTSMFLHVELFHIGFNMLALWFLGPMLESVLGRARFLAVYLVSGLTGSAAVMWFAGANSQTLGASGAIFGLMGALVVVSLKVGADFRQILFWIGINLVFTFYAGASISWQGHIGGLVGGAVVAAAIVYAPRK